MSEDHFRMPEPESGYPQSELGSYSRRRFLAGAGATTGLVWAAPVVTGLSARAFATGSGEPDCGGQAVFTAGIQGATTGTYGTGATVAGFTVTAGSIDIVGPSFFPEIPPDPYDYAIDLDGSGAAETVLSTTSLGPGVYQVTVVLAGDQRGDGDNTTTVELGLGSVTKSLAAGAGPTAYTFTASLAAPAPLTVRHDSGTADFIGMLLLDLTIRLCGTA